MQCVQGHVYLQDDYSGQQGWRIALGVFILLFTGAYMASEVGIALDVSCFCFLHPYPHLVFNRHVRVLMVR